MRRTYAIPKSTTPAEQLRTVYWKTIRGDIMELLRLGPLEVDLSNEPRMTRAQLVILFTGIQKEAGIAPQFWETILTFKHSTNSNYVTLAKSAYAAGIWPAYDQRG